jgi:hypothetical protein
MQQTDVTVMVLTEGSRGMSADQLKQFAWDNSKLSRVVSPHDARRIRINVERLVGKREAGSKDDCHKALNVNGEYVSIVYELVTPDRMLLTAKLPSMGMYCSDGANRMSGPKTVVADAEDYLLDAGFLFEIYESIYHLWKSINTAYPLVVNVIRHCVDNPKDKLAFARLNKTQAKLCREQREKAKAHRDMMPAAST